MFATNNRRSRATDLEQLRDLVLNERQQGRHHECDSFAQACRELVAQAFAPTGGHEDEAVSSAEGGSNYLDSEAEQDDSERSPTPKS